MVENPLEGALPGELPDDCEPGSASVEDVIRRDWAITVECVPNVIP